MNHERSGASYRTAVDTALLIARVFSGIIFAAHGSQKLFGAFGGVGITEFAKMMGFLAYPVAIGEFFGGLGLILGFLSRFSAASNILIMLGAIAMVHGQHGFFLGQGPNDTLAEAGFEYNFALIGLLAPTLIAGPGRFSVGRFLPLPKSTGSDRPILVLE